MHLIAQFLFFAPLLIAAALLLVPKRFIAAAATAGVAALIAVSVAFFAADQVHSFSFGGFGHTLFMLADIVLMLFFAYVGLRQKSKPILYLALLQLVMYLSFLALSGGAEGADIIMNSLSGYMFLVVNVVGGLIIIYALTYIQSEQVSQTAKKSFIALLFFFVAVMNMIVSANSIELFFMLFEMTTLCSYLLIRFRKDAISIQNANRALWMNQIGGVAILAALLAAFFSNAVYFDTLVSHSSTFTVFALSLLAIAAFVKSAQLPFQSWLLGAMVAPTPVSAILHSATMVKIAPFLILKLSGGFEPYQSVMIALFGSFVFLCASLFALSKDYFKEILGYSTIGLLGLMMALAAIDHTLAYSGALFLICFHAVAKGALFLQAGIMEKQYGIKYLSQMHSLADRAPLLSALCALAFAGLTLPPFAVFAGKFMAIEMFAMQLGHNILYLPVLLFAIFGSVILTLLYFRLLSNLYAKNPGSKAPKASIQSSRYRIVSLLMIVLLGSGAFVSLQKFSSFEVLVPLFIIALSLLLVVYFKALGVDRTKLYHCGEKDSAVIANYYFDYESGYKKSASFIAVALMMALVAGGLYG